MPLKPGRPCRHPGCPHLAREGAAWCDTHLPQQNWLKDASRPNANARGYNYHWQEASHHFLLEHPLCWYCLQEDPPRITASTLVDHYTPHRGNMAVFWDESDWRASCKPHHDAKTAKDDGAFGNPVKVTPVG